MKKPSRKYLKNKADRLWSERIRERNNGKCEVCGRPATNPHHIIGRKNLALRHDLRNGCLLCYQCHVGSKVSAHNDPLWFMDWVERERPTDYKYLKKERTAFNYDYLDAIEKLAKKKAD